MADPVSVLSDGMLKVVWVAAIAIITAPTAAELNNAANVDLSCYLTPDGYSTGADQATINDDRLCSTATYEKPGRTTNSLEVMYVYQPQTPAAVDNKAYATLLPYAGGYIVERWGKPFASVFIATDRVDVKVATCGDQNKQPPEANSTLKVGQKIFIGALAKNVAVV